MLPVVYANGLAGEVKGTRKNITALNISLLHSLDFQTPAYVPMPWSTHGGEDVSVYATGAFSHLFHSTVDNTFVAQSMKYALCLHPFEAEPHCSACRFLPTFLPLIVSLLISRLTLS